MSVSEGSVVGAVMLDAAIYWQVADIIGESDFDDAVCREIFESLAERCKAGKPVDAVTMTDVLPQHAHFMIDLAGNALTSTARHHAGVVATHAEERRVRAAGKRIALCRGYGEAQQILAEVAPRNISSAKPIQGYLQGALAKMQERCEQEARVTGLETGLRDLDEATSGLQPGSLNFLAARPSMGKTALAMQIAVRTALRRKRVVVFSMEMSGVQLSERAVSLISGVPFGAIRHPKLVQEEQWPRITDAYGKLEQSALIVDETLGMAFESMAAKALQLHMQEPLSLIVVDHLGLVDLPGKGRPDIEIGNVTKAMKALAKKTSVPLLCLVQLNRGVEQRQDKRPLLSDLRESGRIEEDADVVMMLYRDEYYNKNSPHKGYAELLIRKNRDGETPDIPLAANLSVMRFADCEGLPHAPVISRSSSGFGGFSSRKEAEDD